MELTRTEYQLLELFLPNPARCLRTRRSTTASGATTSARPRTRCACTSATCAASSRRRARAELIHTVRGVATPCGSRERCAARDDLRTRIAAVASLSVRWRCSRRRSAVCRRCARTCGGKSTGAASARSVFALAPAGSGRRAAPERRPGGSPRRPERLGRRAGGTSQGDFPGSVQPAPFGAARVTCSSSRRRHGRGARRAGVLAARSRSRRRRQGDRRERQRQRADRPDVNGTQLAS